MLLKNGSLAFAITILFTGCANLSSPWTTVGAKFRADMAAFEKGCNKSAASRPAGDATCDFLKLQPRDWDHTVLVPVAGQPLPVPKEWVETPEGRFAYSIQLPSPLPLNSGYRSGMTSEEYFHHLCAHEAGQFVYKKIQNLDGIYQARPRKPPGRELHHLYAIEDPGGYGLDGGRLSPWSGWIGPKAYDYLENPELGRISHMAALRWHQSVEAIAPKDAVVSHLYYVQGGGMQAESLRREFKTSRGAKYGYTWRGIRREMDRELGIAGGELIALDFDTNEVLGVFRYYKLASTSKGTFTVSWTTSCSTKINGQYVTYLPISGFKFLSTVLQPAAK